MDNDAGTKTKTVLRLKYTIEEQLYKDQPIARIRFSDGLQDRPYTVERDIKLRPEDMGSFQCSREIVYLLVRKCMDLSHLWIDLCIWVNLCMYK